VLPSSSLTIPEYVQALLAQNTPESCKQALLLQPTNAIALARVGGRVITNLAMADWMTQRAIELAPNLSETWVERATVLEKAGKSAPAHDAMARATGLKHN
jgi:Flp pilus assembly protein TadD